MRLQSGDRVSDYVVEDQIGAGAYCEVWIAHHVESGAPVALKILNSVSVDDEETIRRFRREGEFLASLNSTYVVRFLEFVTDSRGLVLVLEFIDGPTLAEVFSERLLSVEDAIRLGMDLASGVQELHQAGITHRDLKPANLIMRPMPEGDYRATIIDFGLSRFFRQPTTERRKEERSFDGRSSMLTRAGTTMGSLPYMAPEQILDARKAREPADIYAIGAILFEAVTGTFPFGESSEQDHARAKVLKEAPLMEMPREDPVALGLTSVVAQALRRMPQERFASAEEMLHALQRLDSLAFDVQDSSGRW